MNRNVLVVGCGQLGRRHIQGLSRSSSKVVIYIIDNDPKAIVALHAFRAQNYDVFRRLTLHIINFSEQNLLLLPIFDLTVVATTAFARFKLLNNVLSFTQTKHWVIEKPLGQSSTEIKDICKWALNRSAFVNHPRRMMPWYKMISKDLIGNGPIKLKAFYSDFGIACNTSHLVDLVNWWTGSFPISVCTEGLNKEWHQAKRKGFWEIQGVLKIKFNDESMIELWSHEKIRKSILEIEFGCTERCTIDENLGEARFSNGKVVNGKVLYQSDLTGALLDQLYDTGKCDLPTIASGALCSELLVDKLLQHWNSVCKGEGLSLLPAT
jgi:hypothetical protein